MLNIITTCHFLLLWNSLLAQANYYGHDQLTALYRLGTASTHYLILLPGRVSLQEAGTGIVTYTLTDHLNSSRSVINKDHQIMLAADYDPYGKMADHLSATQKAEPKYAGTYNWNDYTHIYSAPARKYDPVTKSFLSPDILRSAYSRYAFVNGNPIRYRDADAESPVDEIANQIRANEDFIKLGQTSSTTRYEWEHGMSIDDRLKTDDPTYMELKARGLSLIAHLDDARFDISDLQYATVSEIMEMNFDDANEKLINAKIYKDIVYKYNFANCGDCAYVMFGELKELFPQANVEMVSGVADVESVFKSNVANPKLVLQQADHSYNILNRDLSTDIYHPRGWNTDIIVVDAWLNKVYNWTEYVQAYEDHNLPFYDVRRVYKDAMIKTRLQYFRNTDLPPLVDLR